uniref:Uncharacterized protein LOC104218450 n=1 Tax=Nicotiana sylvestris TaxID=4096 RepID=A0A1U7VLL8_NICSY|nr:PREDICTED: uncharacterized protein LOC104218450 [Nicotiana sylvestris]
MAAHATEFEVIKQSSMSVWEYHMEFVRLSKYAPQLVSIMDARVRRFVQGLSPLVVKEVATTALHSDINCGKILGSDSRRPHHSGRPGGRSLQQGRASCPKCGRFHSETCYLDIPLCYRCRARGHIHRDYRAPSQGIGGGFSQSSGSSAAISSVGPPAPVGRGVVRGGARGRGVSSRFYALTGR